MLAHKTIRNLAICRLFIGVTHSPKRPYVKGRLAKKSEVHPSTRNPLYKGRVCHQICLFMSTCMLIDGAYVSTNNIGRFPHI